MRIGAFEVREPLPNLKDPCALTILKPWIDVNNVASLLISGLEAQLGAIELARLKRPGNFFDFTRYRPTLHLEEGVRRIRIPNATLSYAKREEGSDLLFLRLLEPHGLAETYVDSVLALLKALRVKRYCLLGSMYDAVPHTRPLIVYGGAVGKEAELDLRKTDVQPSDYQGPTTITFLITQRAPELGIETMWFIAALPQYLSLEEDYVGKVRLMEILNLLFKIPIPKEDFEKAIEQRNMIHQRVEKMPELKNLLPQLEALYELRIRRKEGEKIPSLSTEVEEILWKIGGKESGKA